MITTDQPALDELGHPRFMQICVLPATGYQASLFALDYSGRVWIYSESKIVWIPLTLDRQEPQ
jgi:hypothetical protein